MICTLTYLFRILMLFHPAPSSCKAASVTPERSTMTKSVATTGTTGATVVLGLVSLDLSGLLGLFRNPERIHRAVSFSPLIPIHFPLFSFPLHHH